MSVKAVSWALDEAPVEDPTQALVLVALADHAGRDGVEVWPSVATIAARARVSTRSVQRHLRALEDAGLIVAVQHSSARFPTVYELQLDVVRGDADVTSRGDTHDRGRGDISVTGDKLSGRHPRHPRGDTGDARGDTGVALGVTPMSPESVLNRKSNRHRTGTSATHSASALREAHVVKRRQRTKGPGPGQQPAYTTGDDAHAAPPLDREQRRRQAADLDRYRTHKPDSAAGLADYFLTKTECVKASVAPPEGPVRRHMSTWLKQGFSGDFIRAMIDSFVIDPHWATKDAPAWQQFVGRRDFYAAKLEGKASARDMSKYA